MSFGKRFLAALLVGAMTLGTWYGSQLEIKSQNKEAQKEQHLSKYNRDTTIYFWYSDEKLTDLINKACVDFGERENVHVLPVLVEQKAYLETINQASLAEEQMPDVYMVSHVDLEKAYLSGLATTVEDSAQILDDQHFGLGALAAVTYKDKYVAYPFTFDTTAMVFNETYLRDWANQRAMREIATRDEEETTAITKSTSSSEEEKEAAGLLDDAEVALLADGFFAEALPITIEDVLDIADTYDAPAEVEAVLSWDVSDVFYNYWFVGDSIDVGGRAGDRRSQVDIDNPSAVAAMKAYQDLRQFFSIESDKVSYEAVVNDFLQGKTVFTIATTDIVKRLEEAKENGEFAFDYGFVRLPRVSEEINGLPMSMTSCVAINGYSVEKALAEKFAVYLCDEIAGSVYERTGKASANRRASMDEAAGGLSIFAEEYEDSIPLPKLMEMENFWLELEITFSKVWNGADPEKSLKELDETMRIQLGY